MTSPVRDGILARLNSAQDTERKDALGTLAKLEESNRDIVSAVLEVRINDELPSVRMMAESVLQKPVHQQVLKQNPDLDERARPYHISVPKVVKAQYPRIFSGGWLLIAIGILMILVPLDKGYILLFKFLPIPLACAGVPLIAAGVVVLFGDLFRKR